MTNCMLMVNPTTSLHQYCVSKHWDYQTIRRYILKLGYSMEDAIEKYKTVRGRRDVKTKYFYKGETLKNFCKKNNYSYTTILHKINRLEYTVEEAVELYVKWKDRKNV